LLHFPGANILFISHRILVISHSISLIKLLILLIPHLFSLFHISISDISLLNAVIACNSILD
jgi:hypothetical protein